MAGGETQTPVVGTLASATVVAIRQAVLRTLDPALIVIFGSQATGQANDDSDIDVLVVDDHPFSATRSRRRLIGDIRRNIPPGRYPVDILLFDDSELNAWRDTTNHVLSRALREGVVLYERPRAR